MAKNSKEQDEIKESMPEIIPEKTSKLKVKVISAGDYMLKAREIFGQDQIWENAVALLYSENKVMAVLDRKGESKFVVEI